MTRYARRSVHMTLSLGYNVLFQDVDVTWQEDPLAWLRSNQEGDFDVYFEDDGARSLRYAPWSANSGFYYLKHNRRTSYLMTNLLYESDNILVSHSHQQVLSSLLNDHSSQYGLVIKVLSREEFTGGKSFHHDKPFMLEWMKGEKRAARTKSSKERSDELMVLVVAVPLFAPRYSALYTNSLLRSSDFVLGSSLRSSQETGNR